MPSGNVPLLEAAKCGDNTLKRGVVEVLIQESPFLEQLPWMTIAGNAYEFQVEENLPTVAFRNVNEGYSKSWGTDTSHFYGVAILGGEVFVDNYLINVTGNVIDPKVRQYRKFAKAMAMTYDKYALDGTGTAKDFKGINALIDEGWGQKLINASGGGALDLDKMDEAHDLLRTGTADAILANRTQRRKITKLARTSVSGTVLIDVGDDAFGRQVTQWNGIGIRILGDDQNGTALLGYDEDPGDSTSDCSSMYFVRYGEDFVTGLMGAGGRMEVRDFGETEAAPGHLGRVEWYPGLAIFNKYAIVRLYGITNA